MGLKSKGKMEKRLVHLAKRGTGDPLRGINPTSEGQMSVITGIGAYP